MLLLTAGVLPRVSGSSVVFAPWSTLPAACGVLGTALAVAHFAPRSSAGVLGATMMLLPPGENKKKKKEKKMLSASDPSGPVPGRDRPRRNLKLSSEQLRSARAKPRTAAAILSSASD